MKSGSGDDLLDEVDNSDEEEVNNNKSEAEIENQAPDNPLDTSTDETGTEEKTKSDQSVPYLLVRSGVKDRRDVVGVGLQKETRDLESKLLSELEDEIGVSNLPVMDLREAAYLVGLYHAEETKEILLNWGYEHRG
jgi:hypothetical protein